jgi:hypothetical protein
MQDSPPAGPTSLRCRKAPPLGVDVSCVNVLVSVPSDMSHRIVAVDRDLEVMHRRLGRYDLGDHWMAHTLDAYSDLYTHARCRDVHHRSMRPGLAQSAAGAGVGMSRARPDQGVAVAGGAAVVGGE